MHKWRAVRILSTYLRVWLTPFILYGLHGKCPWGMKYHLAVSNVYIQSHGFILTSTCVFVYAKPYFFLQSTASKAAGHKAVYCGGCTIFKKKKKIWQPPQNSRRNKMSNMKQVPYGRPTNFRCPTGARNFCTSGVLLHLTYWYVIIKRNKVKIR